MSIYFGVVKKYITEKGFGFITDPISIGPSPEIFFHVSKVERSSTYVANQLDDYIYYGDICFWYETESTPKGEQLKKVLRSQEVYKLDKDHLNELIERIEIIYENVQKTIPFWVKELALGLISAEDVAKLTLKRKALLQKRDGNWIYYE